MSTFYIAKSRDHPLRKVLENDGGRLFEPKQPFPELFDFEPVEIGYLDDAFALLTRLVDDPQRAIVLGKPQFPSGARSTELFDDCECDLMVVDLDSVPERETTQATIIDSLPFLHGKAFIYAFSGSSKFKPGLRVRVICRIEAANLARQKFIAQHYEGELKVRIGGLGKDKHYIDPSIFKPSGLIYTARPELIGLKDPHPVRVFKVDGDETPIAFTLPKTVKIQIPAKRRTEPPALTGFVEGNRNNAMWAYCVQLKLFLGHEFENKAKRRKHWDAQIAAVGATASDVSEYTRLFEKRCLDVRVTAGDTREIEVIANDDNSIPLDVAETQMRDGLHKAIQSYNDVAAFIVTTGVGKTKVVLDLIAAHNKANQFTPFLAYYYLPTIEMCEQACSDAKKLGMKAMVRRGRGQEVDGEPMCQKYDTVEIIQAIDMNVSEHVCKSEEYECPYFHTCAWQQQKEDQKHSEIVFLPHSYLTLKQKTQLDKPNLVIIDEAPWVSTLVHNHSIELSELCKRRYDMHEWVQAFERLEGDLTIENLRRNGFTQEIFHALGKSEESLNPQLPLNPSMGKHESFKAVKGFEAKWYDYKRVWKALERSMRDGHLNRILIENGRVYTHWRSKIDAIPKTDGIHECPVIILDATAQETVLRAYMNLDAVYRIDVKPHPQAIFTHIETSGSMKSYLYGIRGDENETNEDKIDEARRCRERDQKLAVKHDASWLTYKALEEHVDYESMGHFGALEGLNKFNGHNLVVSGRPLPPPFELENIAAAVFQNDPMPIRRIKWTVDNYWYPTRNVAKRGGGYITTEYHPDDRVEAVRKMICDGQVMQAAGRARYVRHPAHVILVNRLALPLTFTRTTTASRVEYADLELKNVLPLTQSEALRMYPEFKDSRKAQRILRPLFEELVKKDALYFDYRRAGARGPASLALAMHESDLAELGDITYSELEMTKYGRYNQGRSIRREVRDMLAAGGVAWLEELGDGELCWTEVTDDEDGGFRLPLPNWQQYCGASSG
jgi:hypothetical protein